jgi:hypothetical protein
MKLPDLTNQFVPGMSNEETWWFIKFAASGLLTVVFGVIVAFFIS